MKQPYVSTLIEQDFTSAEKALGRHNIDAISSADLEGYATQEWVQDQNYITSADLPDVSDMATKTWTSENFYADTNPSGFITSSDVPRYREGDYISIDPVTLAISVAGINPDDYLTSADMSQYATHEEVESATSRKMDSTEASAFYPRYDNPEGYITSADLPDLSEYVTSADVSGFVDVNYVENNFYSASNPSGFVTSADLPDLSDYATKTYVDENFYSASNPSGFITSADLPDLSEYATIQYVDNSINSATSAKQDSLVFGYTDNKISSINNSAIYSSGGGSFTQEQSDWAEDDNTQVDYIKNKPTQVVLEAISPLYITDETSASKIGIYSSAFPNMSSYATKVYVNSSVSSKQDKLTFGYTDNLISSINSSGIYGAGGSFTQEQSDWTEANTASASYIKNKPSPVGLSAGTGINLIDHGTSIEIECTVSGGGSVSSDVEVYNIPVTNSGTLTIITPASGTKEMHVNAPRSYYAAQQYSAYISDDGTFDPDYSSPVLIPSGCWYDFSKIYLNDGYVDPGYFWAFKQSGTFQLVF